MVFAAHVIDNGLLVAADGAGSSIVSPRKDLLGRGSEERLSVIGERDAVSELATVSLGNAS